ncbi:MAG: DUF4834 family protein [Mediterranea sp.]|nr:DUF4834 family protein [Mediterranea sp.]
MFHILGFLFIIILVILIIGLSILGSVVRFLFGARRRQVRPHTYARTSEKREDTVNTEEGELHINRKKIFGKDEGEYVDFEEINE